MVIGRHRQGGFWVGWPMPEDRDCRWLTAPTVIEVKVAGRRVIRRLVVGHSRIAERLRT